MKVVEVINSFVVLTSCLVLLISNHNHHFNIVLVQVLYIVFYNIFVDEDYDIGYIICILPLFLVSIVTKYEISIEIVIICSIILFICKFGFYRSEKIKYDYMNFIFGISILFIQIQDKLMDVNFHWFVTFLFANTILGYSKALEYCSSFEISAFLTAFNMIIYDLVCNFCPTNENTISLKVVEIGILSFVTLFIITSKVNQNNIEIHVTILVFISVLTYVYISHILDCDLMLWIIKQLINNQFQSVWICTYWIFCIVLSVIISVLSLSMKIKQICIRKIFHIAVVIMFTPVLLIKGPSEPFLTLALGVALCGFLAIEYCRIYLKSLSPVVTANISYYYEMLIDSRDKNNKFIVSHIYLLLSVAFPIWISHAIYLFNPNIFNGSTILILFPYIGIVTVGTGDAFGAIIGSSFGSVLLCKETKRTIEGSCAVFVSILSFLVLLIFVLNKSLLTWFILGKMIVLTLITTTVEAFTQDNDNIMLPLIGSTVLLIEHIIF